MDPLTPALLLLSIIASSICLGFIFGKNYQKGVQKETEANKVE